MNPSNMLADGGFSCGGLQTLRLVEIRASVPLFSCVEVDAINRSYCVVDPDFQVYWPAANSE